ncbi:ribonuclease domain-containing protein [Bacillus swezeyi]|uniref:Ribonuclease n=1 Tax=Bacillus swezeyi TaxID=1925020 RepID=A0A1R1Q955_9BACI|nr:ribonuclease [Bacillus swezeyi]MEC1259492.1 ribonuclease domain-containing protein [Bacillus swezeyi]MED2927546.1 ribonuclease domain-containing protein [Bacillus swezeyi]MED2962744.1 ribonuclease domain-containing protein [Bacillus swezeyi]MED3071802.1 ribonuclease domain-containing protein [Bacillus swezeyi]MED3080558.1 ribonuclease domain-containing protein [Bacillus swezeyi]
MKKLLTSLALGVILTLGFLAGILPPSSADGPQTTDGSSVQTDSIINTFEGVADYIVKYGRLPDNFITKAEAAKLGWEPQKGNLAEVAPGKTIGGDIFKNREKLLPDAEGRVWREADINYTSGFRGSDRIVYSNDRLVYKTTDHYKTFTRMR